MSYQIRFFGREIRLNRILVLALAIVVLAFLFLNNGSVSLVEEKLTVVGLADSLENYRILVISDMNGQRFGDKQSALLRTINAANYQAIIFLGDMVGSGGDPEPFYELLEGIPAGKKVFFIARRFRSFARARYTSRHHRHAFTHGARRLGARCN